MKKNWYKSKTVWTAVITGVIGVLLAVGVTIPEWVLVMLGGAGLYGLRDAIK